VNEAGGGYVEAGAASDAFKPLGNETRVAVLRAMFERADGHLRPTTRTFSELFEATEESTTAGFAYHLRQLVGPYLRKREDESYELTYAGLQVGRGLAAGTYTESVDREPVGLAEDCPLCGEAELALRATDNVATVGCDACGRELLGLPFPPGGFRSHDADSLPAAFDRHHRHRIGLMADGNCPECGGRVEGRIEVLDGGTEGAGRRDASDVEATDEDERDEADGREDAPRALASLDCVACGYALGCPVTLTALSHPAVVSFFHDHGVDLRERPIWNVGPEWGERVVSTDPVAVRVSATLDGETLALYVGRDLTVVHTERAGDDDPNDAVDATGTGDEAETTGGDREVDDGPCEESATAESDAGPESATA
jgi:Zn ribbon nucleic-acid-binding protein